VHELTLWQEDVRGHDEFSSTSNERTNEYDSWQHLYVYIRGKAEGSQCKTAGGDKIELSWSKVLYLQSRQRALKLLLMPQTEYEVGVSGWGPGVESTFWLSASSAEPLELKTLPPPRPPSIDEQRAMRRVRSREPLCLHCTKSCSGRDGVQQSAVFHTDDGQVHEGCYEGYQNATADRCEECGEPIRGEYVELKSGKGDDRSIKLHAKGCLKRRTEAGAKECALCRLKIVEGSYRSCPADKGKPGAPSYPAPPGAEEGLEEGQRQQFVHDACAEGFRIAIADVCAFCHEPIVLV